MIQTPPSPAAEDARPLLISFAKFVARANSYSPMRWAAEAFALLSAAKTIAPEEFQSMVDEDAGKTQQAAESGEVVALVAALKEIDQFADPADRQSRLESLLVSAIAAMDPAARLRFWSGAQMKVLLNHFPSHDAASIAPPMETNG